MERGGEFGGGLATCWVQAGFGTGRLSALHWGADCYGGMARRGNHVLLARKAFGHVLLPTSTFLHYEHRTHNQVKKSFWFLKECSRQKMLAIHTKLLIMLLILSTTVMYAKTSSRWVYVMASHARAGHTVSVAYTRASPSLRMAVDKQITHCHLINKYKIMHATERECMWWHRDRSAHATHSHLLYLHFMRLGQSCFLRGILACVFSLDDYLCSRQVNPCNLVTMTLQQYQTITISNFVVHTHLLTASSLKFCLYTHWHIVYPTYIHLSCTCLRQPHWILQVNPCNTA